MASLRTSVRFARNLRVAAPRAAAVSPRVCARAYSTPAPEAKQGGNSSLLWAAVLAGAAGAAYCFRDDLKAMAGGESASKVPKKEDYQAVYNEIAKILENADYDDGSYAPVLIRLAWHSSGTYDKKSNTGGSNGATMRFPPEANHSENPGLHNARDVLEPIKKKFPWISYSDLWTLAGVAAVQEMGGPKIPWRPGREDKPVESTPPDGRLPHAPLGADHIRDVFHRMGFNDQEAVALIGAHAVGRCHTKYSGFDGPWTFSPISFTNQFFTLLLDEAWVPKKWEGPFQYVDKNSNSIMMLPTDYALIKDSTFKKHVQAYAKDEEKFFKDFAAAFATLIELGVPSENFKKAAESLGDEQPLVFTPTADQE